MSVAIKKDYPDGYPEDALEVLRKMSFTNGTSVNIVGSMSLRSQIYAGDYDAIENVTIYGNIDNAIKNLVRDFKNIIRRVQSIPNTCIGDIKSGSVEEWVIIDSPYNFSKSRSQLEKLHREGIITDEEHREGIKRIKPKVSKLELLKLQRDFRPNIIRWSPREVLVGFKKLQDGRRFTLSEAFQTPVITKLDVISWVQNNRFTDFSMIYQFRHKSKILNPSVGDIDISIRKNIFMLHHEGNFFKMAKRMFSLARYNNYTKLLDKLSLLFNGDAGRLYNVYGDIGTLESLLDLDCVTSRAKIDFEIEQFKGRLSNISLTEYIDKEHHIFALIDEIRNTSNKSDMIKLLKELKDILSKLMSEYSKEFLLKNNLMPIY
jgi:hypothetical protein